MWLANLADLELHASLARADAYDRPTTLAFELTSDPESVLCTLVSANDPKGDLCDLIGALLLVSWWIAVIVLVAIVPSVYLQFKLSREQIAHWNTQVDSRRQRRMIEQNLLRPQHIAASVAAGKHTFAEKPVAVDGPGVRKVLEAARIAQSVFLRNPDHPGAAHSWIHGMDDPEHASGALEAARSLSGIAPAAPHAQHMTSHIFMALGMWDDVVRANEQAEQVVEHVGRALGAGAPTRLRVFDGRLSTRDRGLMMSTQNAHEILEVGVVAMGPDMVDHCIPGQPEEPAPEGNAPRFVSRKRFQGLDEDELRQVLRVRRVAEHPAGDAGEGDGAGSRCRASQASNLSAGMTSTCSAIRACCSPQNSAHWPR